MSDALPYPYNLGMAFPVMPMAPVAAHCLSVPSGPVTLVVEARDLAIDRRYSEYGDDGPIEPDETFDDFGTSLHVNGAADGIERLRFDCFDKEPHYHYIRPEENANIICRLDDIAEGDSIEWTISRLRHRLPEMLEHANARELADAVRADLPTLFSSLDIVREMLDEARRRTIARRTATV